MDTAGIPWYNPPDRIDYEQIDPAVRDLVRKINACGWMHTTMSCSGHPVDTDERDEWSGPGLGRWEDQLRKDQVWDWSRGSPRYLKKPFDPYAWQDRVGARWVSILKDNGNNFDDPEARRWSKVVDLSHQLCGNRWRTEARIYLAVYDIVRWARFHGQVFKVLREEMGDPFRVTWLCYYGSGAPDGSWHYIQTIFRYLVAAERAAYFAAWERALAEV